MTNNAKEEFGRRREVSALCFATNSWLSKLGLLAAITTILAMSAGMVAAAVRGRKTHGTMPRELEIKYALSALPPHLRAVATVYVLDPTKGYVVARGGTNGFHCFVARTEYSRDDFPTNMYSPISFDPEGAKTILLIYFDVARIRIEGKLGPEETHQLVLQRLKDGEYRLPSRPGISYMVSPVMTGYRAPGSKDVITMNMPHLMFYAPNLFGDDVGARPPRGMYPYLFDAGLHGYMIQNMGETEKGRITEESKKLLKELCAYRSDLCLLNGPSAHGH